MEDSGVKWEIKSDYQHQLFYRKVLDELEDRFKKARSDLLNTSWKDPSAEEKTREYDRARMNYLLVSDRYNRERFTRGWGH